MPQSLTTLAADFRKALAANGTDTAFTDLDSTLTQPTGDGVINFGNGEIYNGFIVVLFGAGEEDATFSARFIAWREFDGEWIPVNLLELACILSARTGAVGGPVGSDQRYADTISKVSGSDGATDIVSPENDTIAHCLMDQKGFPKLQVQIATGDSATSGNVLLAPI